MIAFDLYHTDSGDHVLKRPTPIMHSSCTDCGQCAPYVNLCRTNKLTYESFQTAHYLRNESPNPDHGRTDSATLTAEEHHSHRFCDDQNCSNASRKTPFRSSFPCGELIQLAPEVKFETGRRDFQPHAYSQPHPSGTARQTVVLRIGCQQSRR